MNGRIDVADAVRLSGTENIWHRAVTAGRARSLSTAFASSARVAPLFAVDGQWP